jgi:hypothetical protein
MTGRTELRFQIGDAFPAEDPIARWLTGLAMASNDFFRMFRWVECAELVGTQVLAFRIQAAAIFEAATHLGDTLRLVPEVKAFVDRLPPDAANERDRVLAAVDKNSEHYIGDWAEPHRNVTFHYPEMHPAKAEHGQSEIQQALELAAHLRSSISYGESPITVRFEFADEVAVQWLPEATPDDPAAVEALRDAGVALAKFAQRAIGAYLEELPEGIVERPS